MYAQPFFVILLSILFSCAPEKESGNTDTGSSLYKSFLQPSESAGLSVYSGYKEVFENRDTNQGRRIRIFVTVIPARSDSTLSPIFHFEGGPGQPANSALPFYAAFPELNEHRDIVLIDTRGTGKSNGLYCSALHYDPAEPFMAFEDMLPPERLKACLEEYKNLADLTQYSTANVIEDAEEIRKWLGYGKVNLIGFSYGTRVIEAYLRIYPESIRCAVMGGAAPASMHRPESFAKDAQAAWELICRDCAADPDCAAQYPNLDGDMKTLLNRFDKGPVSFTYQNPVTGAAEKLQLRRGPITEAIRTVMYSTDGQRKLPYIIHEAATGNYGPIVERTIRRSMGYRELSSSLFLCITCSEDVPFINPESIASLTDDTFLSDYRIRQETAGCELWPRHPFSEDQTRPVETDVPVLIVSGSHDPVTPPRWAALMSRGMRNVSHVTVVFMGHSPFGLSNQDCLSSGYAAFFDKPEPGFGLPCTAEMKPVGFRF